MHEKHRANLENTRRKNRENKKEPDNKIITKEKEN